MTVADEQRRIVIHALAEVGVVAVESPGEGIRIPGWILCEMTDTQRATVMRAAALAKQAMGDRSPMVCWRHRNLVAPLDRGRCAGVPAEAILADAHAVCGLDP